MTQAETLADMVGALMRVLLVSERTPRDYQHVIRYNPLDFHTLGLLRQEPGLRASALASRLGVAPTTASSLIARLVKQGVISREKSRDDGRAVALSLTKEGQTIAQAIRAQDLKNMELFLSALEPAEQTALLAALGKVVARVEALDPPEA